MTQQELANPLQVARSSPAQAAVLAWLALYTSLQAYEVPVPVLLKEYLPGTHGVALNEVRMVSQLAPVPAYDRKWRAASSQADNLPPVVPLLGAPKPAHCGGPLAPARAPPAWPWQPARGLQPRPQLPAASRLRCWVAPCGRGPVPTDAAPHSTAGRARTAHGRPHAGYFVSVCEPGWAGDEWLGRLHLWPGGARERCRLAGLQVGGTAAPGRVQPQP